MRKLFIALLLLISWSLGATTYYIDPAGNNGNDGSAAHPWLTLYYACGHAISGDIIHVNAGTYVENTTCNLAVGASIEGEGITSIISSTTATAYWFTIALISASEGTNGNQHISGIKMDGNSVANGPIWMFARSNVSIYNCTFVNFNTCGIKFYGKASGAAGEPTTYATGNTFHDNIVTNCGTNYAGSNADAGFSFGGQTGLLIYNNTITQNARATYTNPACIRGVLCEGWNKGVKIYNNTLITDSTTDIGHADAYNFAIELWNNYGMEIYNNHIYGCVDIAGAFELPGTYSYSVSLHNNFIGWSTLQAAKHLAIIIEASTTLSDVLIYSNTIRNVDRGIMLYPLSGVTYSNIKIYYNIFDQIGFITSGWQGVSAIWGSSGSQTGYTYQNLYILNNVFIASTYAGAYQDAGVHIFNKPSSTWQGIYIRNNIFIGWDIGVIETDATGTITSLNFENNDCYGNGNSNNPYLQVTPIAYVNQNNFKTDPLFASATSLYLQASSPCINTGTNVGLTTDYYGYTIVGLPDVGALECTYYYIDPSGTDGGGHTGAIGDPWKTLYYACGHTISGNTIHVNAGVYTENTQCELAVGVSIEGVSPVSRIISNESRTYYHAINAYSGTEGVNGNQHISGIILDGNSLTAYSGVLISGRSNFKIYNCTFRDCNKSGVTFNGGVSYYDHPPAIYATGNEFHDNVITNCADYAYGTDAGNGCLQIGGQEGLLIYNNVITNNLRPLGYNGYCIKFYSNGYCKGLKIYNNTLTASCQVAGGGGTNYMFCIELWYVQGGNEIYNNTIHGALDFNGSFKDAKYPRGMDIHDNFIGWDTLPPLSSDGKSEVGIHGEVDMSDVYIYHNHFKNLCNPLCFTSTAGKTQSNINIYYNDIENVGANTLTNYKGWGIYIDAIDWCTYHNWNILNNTFRAKTVGGTVMWGVCLPHGNVTKFTIRNNIIYGFNWAPIYLQNSPYAADSVSIENNIMYLNGNSNNPKGTATLTHYTLANNLNSNPLLISPQNFRLQSASPAINAGIDVGLTVDYGDTLIVGLPDIGAHEYYAFNPAHLATVITLNPTHVWTLHATIGGNVTSNGGGTISARGICYGILANPTIAYSHTSNGTGVGSFTSELNELSSNHKYYLRAYVTNEVGTSYGDTVSFMTPKFSPIMTNGKIWRVSGKTKGLGDSNLSLSTLAKGLVSYWKLDESMYGADDSKDSNIGTPTSCNQDSIGKRGTAFKFGLNSYVDMGNPANLSLTSHGTLAAWIYPTTLTTGKDHFILSKDDYTNDLNGYALWVYGTSGQLIAELNNATQSTTYTSSKVCVKNTWQLVAITWDGSTVKIYRNGSGTPFSQAQGNSVLSATQNFRLGKNATYADTYFYGRIDEVGVWNRTLSGAGIDSLYNSGNGTTYPFY